MVDTLSDFLFLQLDSRSEVRVVNLFQGWRRVLPIFIVVHDLPKMISVIADRHGENCDWAFTHLMQCLKLSATNINA